MRALYPDNIILMAGKECAKRGADFEGVMTTLKNWKRNGLESAADVNRYMKQVDDQKTVVGSVDREHTLRVQTPQVFHADIIKGALTVAVNRGLTFTDDCSAVELMAVKTHVVPGDEDNIKLTTPRDLLFASAILRDRGDAL